MKGSCEVAIYARKAAGKLSDLPFRELGRSV